MEGCLTFHLFFQPCLFIALWFSSYDPDISQLIGRLNIKGNWNRKKLNAIAPLLKKYAFSIDIQKVDLTRLLDFLQKNRNLMVRLIEYRNLLVRISGYNAYFVHLNREMQLELIERTEYGLSGC